VGLPRLTGFEGLLRKVQLSTGAGFRPRFRPLDAVRSPETGTNSGTQVPDPASAECGGFETRARDRRAAELLKVLDEDNPPRGHPLRLIRLLVSACHELGGRPSRT
jgi:hypothetical protein